MRQYVSDMLVMLRWTTYFTSTPWSRWELGIVTVCLNSLERDMLANRSQVQSVSSESWQSVIDLSLRQWRFSENIQQSQTTKLCNFIYNIRLMNEYHSLINILLVKTYFNIFLQLVISNMGAQHSIVNIYNSVFHLFDAVMELYKKKMINSLNLKRQRTILIQSHTHNSYKLKHSNFQKANRSLFATWHSKGTKGTIDLLPFVSSMGISNSIGCHCYWRMEPSFCILCLIATYIGNKTEI